MPDTQCRKPEEHFWMCTNCDTLNPMDVLQCEDCGMPRQFSESSSSSEEGETH